jgi:esterase/lipase
MSKKAPVLSFISIIFLISHLSFSVGATTKPITSSVQFEWFMSANPNAYVLMVHGLNLHPTKMHPFARLLQQNNFSVLNVILSGHGNLNDTTRLHAFTQVNYALWLAEMREAYAIISHEAQRKPLFFFGYSLGALMGINLITQEPKFLFDRALLIAPALRIHSKAYIVYPLFLFPKYIIDSASPPSFRANKGTPVNAYLALYQAIANLDNPPDRLNFPVKIIIDPKDELVSYPKLKQWISDHSLTQWSINTVNKRPLRQNDFHHLLIEEKGAGNIWKPIQDTLLHFFLNQ